MESPINKQCVKKYEIGGDEALKDKQGRNKVEAELSPEDKIRIEMKKLEQGFIIRKEG